MTPFKIQMTPDPFVDDSERDKICKFLKSKTTKDTPSNVIINDKYCGVDLGWHFKGKFWAVEVAKTELWPVGSVPFSGNYFEIPLRKWDHMFYVLYGKEGEDVCTYDCGMYCLLSHDLTHTVIFNMQDLLKIDVEYFENYHDRVIWGNTVRLVKVPPTLVKKYEKL